MYDIGFFCVCILLYRCGCGIILLEVSDWLGLRIMGFGGDFINIVIEVLCVNFVGKSEM